MYEMNNSTISTIYNCIQYEMYETYEMNILSINCMK